MKNPKKIKSKNDQNSEDQLKIYSLNKIIYLIKDKRIENPGTVFEVKLLKNIYIDISKFHRIFVESHVIRFLKVFKENIQGLEILNGAKE